MVGTDESAAGPSHGDQLLDGWKTGCVVRLSTESGMKCWVLNLFNLGLLNELLPIIKIIKYYQSCL